MDNIRFSRDPKDPVPEGLNEVEQQAVMLKAVKQRGGIRQGEELTAVPFGTPPLPGGWTAVGNVNAPSGKPYRIYMKFPGGHGHGPLGSRHNKPKGDTGTMARTQHKPNKTTGTPTDPPPTEKPKPIETPPQKAWLGSIESDKAAEFTEKLKNVVEDPGSTEKDITDAIQKAIGAQRQLVLMGGEGDPRIQEMNEQIADAIEIISETRNSDFESVLRKERLSPGSQSEKAIKEHLEKAFGSMRQRQLMGFPEDEKEYKRTEENINKAIETLADRQADRIEDVLKKTRTPGANVSEKELSDAAQELFALSRQLQLMGMSRPKAAQAMGDVDELLLAMVKRKTESRDALIQKKSTPNSGVTDADVDRANMELEILKNQVRQFGVSVP